MKQTNDRKQQTVTVINKQTEIYCESEERKEGKKREETTAGQEMQR